jgi:hypothetical protein
MQEEANFVCKCCKCGKESEEEKDFNICKNCEKYVCPEHSVTIEQQGVNVVFCSKKCKKDHV